MLPAAIQHSPPPARRVGQLRISDFHGLGPEQVIKTNFGALAGFGSMLAERPFREADLNAVG